MTGFVTTATFRREMERRDKIIEALTARVDAMEGKPVRRPVELSEGGMCPRVAPGDVE